MPPKRSTTATRQQPERITQARTIALNADILGEIPVERARETLLYRATFIPNDEEPDPLFVQPHRGRWPTAWTLYTGSAETVAWAEYCRNNAGDVALSDVTGGVGVTAASLYAFARLEVALPLPLRSLYELTFEFTMLADLTSPWAEECLRKSGFDLDSFYADASVGYGACPELAALVDRLGWEAMRVPSAAWPRADGWCVPVFASGRGRLVGSRRLVEAAGPSVAVAVATEYASGERPDWLGPDVA